MDLGRCDFDAVILCIKYSNFILKIREIELFFACIVE
jgi:hypothetical protein